MNKLFVSFLFNSHSEGNIIWITYTSIRYAMPISIKAITRIIHSYKDENDYVVFQNNKFFLRRSWRNSCYQEGHLNWYQMLRTFVFNYTKKHVRAVQIFDMI